MPVDPALADLLEASADRNLAALAALTEDVRTIRKELAADRERDDGRLGHLEDDVGALSKAVQAIAETVRQVDERCGALVVEEEGEDGTRTVTARPAKIGVDAKTLLGFVVTLVTAGVVPVLIAYLTHAAG